MTSGTKTPPIYLPERTYLVDSYNFDPGNNSYLVRGNEPLTVGKDFAYDALNTKLQSLIGNNFDLAQYNLLDISVIDDVPHSERGILETEFSTFGITGSEFDAYFPVDKSWPPVTFNIDVKKAYGASVSGQSGSIIWYPVQGCTSLKQCQAQEPALYRFSELISFIRTLISTQIQTVVYFHCQHGDDRTSAIHASYLMQYKQYSLAQVLDNPPPLGAKIFKHPWEPTYQQLVEYYATCL